MARATIALRFRIKSAIAYLAVSSIAVIYVQWRLQWPLTDSWLVVGYAAFTLFATTFGAFLAHWYAPDYTGSFEVISVPIIVFVLAAFCGSLVSTLWTGIPAAAVRSVSLYEWASSTVFPALSFLSFALAPLATFGLLISLLLRHRASMARFAA